MANSKKIKKKKPNTAVEKVKKEKPAEETKHKGKMDFVWNAGAAVIITLDILLDKLGEAFLAGCIVLRKFGRKLFDKLIDGGAYITVLLDILVEKLLEALIALHAWLKKLLRILFDKVIDAGAAATDWADHVLAVVEWMLTRTLIFILRRVYYIRLELHQYRKEILKTCIFLFASMLGIVLLAGSVIDYEYSYNGKTLGIVREQQDVLQILDLVSEELTLEYGSNISINPDTDIRFTAVISDGKEIDDIDTVLRKFTYMGDVQAMAYGIVVDGERMLTVESEQIANEVLDTVMKTYLKNEDLEDYEYIGFAEEIEIEPYNTTLAAVTSKSAAINKLKSGGQKEETYKVVSGDTIYGICEKLDLSFKELQAMNPDLDIDDTLHIGDKFVIQKEVPLLTVETVEVSTFAEAIDYETINKESSSYYVGDTIITRAGQKGKARITARLTKHNGDIVEREDLERVVITEPVDKIVVKGTKVPPPKKGTGTFIRPVNVGVYRGYGMRWGRMHYGLDYAAPTGTPIYAADGGTVVAAKWHGNFGYYVKIDHGGGYQTLYAHNSKMYVNVGDKVFKGQKIAAVGNTGRSTGPHCHFEVFKYGKNINPASVL